MSWLVGILSTLGVGALGVAVYLWREVSRLHERASSAEALETENRRLKSEITKLENSRKIQAEPRPLWGDVVDGL